MLYEWVKIIKCLGFARRWRNNNSAVFEVRMFMNVLALRPLAVEDEKGSRSDKNLKYVYCYSLSG